VVERLVNMAIVPTATSTTMLIVSSSRNRRLFSADRETRNAKRDLLLVIFVLSLLIPD
jgi:hypothetical protein